MLAALSPEPRAISIDDVRRRRRQAAMCMAYVVTVLLMDMSSRSVERMNSVAAFFPADGLALAFLWVFGLRFTPIVLLAYVTSSCLLFHVYWPIAVGASIVGSGLQAGVVLLLRPLLRGDLARGRMADLGKFLLAVLAMCTSGGLLLRFTLIASGDITAAQGNAAFFTISVGLATGALMMASPAALAAERLRSWLLTGRWRDLWPAREAGERRRLTIDALLLILSTVLTVVVAFSPRTREYEPLYLCFLPVIVLALRRGLPGATIAIPIVDAAVIVAFRAHGLPSPELDKIEVLQLAMSLMGLILGTTVTERRTAQHAARAADGIRHDAELTQRVAQRNQELRLVLDSVNEGLLGVTADGVLRPERSAMVDRWFGPTTNDTKFVDYIGPIDPNFAQNFSLGFELLQDDVLPFDLCLSQLPTRLRHGDLQLKVSYLPLGTGGPRDGLLVVINDITDDLKVAQRDMELQDQLAAFRAFVHDRSGFLLFLEEADQIFEELASGSLDHVTGKRLLHTLKGNSSTAGIAHLAQKCHDVEDVLDDGDTDQLKDLAGALRAHWLVITEPLRTLVAGDSRGVIEVPTVELDRLCAEMERGLPVNESLHRLAGLRFELAENHLARLANQARALSRQLGKGDPVVEIAAHGLRLNPTRWFSLFSVMGHMVRNAVDHGFETADERAAAGKPLRPSLRLSISLRTGELAVEIEDDGRGIDWTAIRQSACRRGLVAETEQDLIAALFTSGVTSRDDVTATSGRGVGLSAVHDRVRELDGSIGVTSLSGAGTCWKISFPVSSSSTRFERNEDRLRLDYGIVTATGMTSSVTA